MQHDILMWHYCNVVLCCLVSTLSLKGRLKTWNDIATAGSDNVTHKVTMWFTKRKYFNFVLFIVCLSVCSQKFTNSPHMLKWRLWIFHFQTATRYISYVQHTKPNQEIIALCVTLSLHVVAVSLRVL